MEKADTYRRLETNFLRSCRKEKILTEVHGTIWTATGGRYFAESSEEIDGLDFALNWISQNSSSDDDPTMKVVVCARYDLKMSAGKLAAQVGHAIHSVCRESDEDVVEEWESEESASKIVVLGVKDEISLTELIERSELLGVGVFPIEDAGRTEVDPGTMTVAAIGPCYEELINLITGSLRPYKVPQVGCVSKMIQTEED